MPTKKTRDRDCQPVQRHTQNTQRQSKSPSLFSVSSRDSQIYVRKSDSDSMIVITVWIEWIVIVVMGNTIIVFYTPPSISKHALHNQQTSTCYMVAVYNHTEVYTLVSNPSSSTLAEGLRKWVPTDSRLLSAPLAMA